MAAFEESAAPTSTSAQEFYTWTFPGAPVRIHLHLNVVESLGREVRRAFESVPSHSVEIGGILYGTADFAANRMVEIKDFEPFLCEYRSDHKFILADGDRRKLDRLLGARRADGPEALSVVGYYRAHIGEGLSLRQEDVAVAQAHFYDPANVFLLVKPAADGSASAGFFFWDNGRIDAEFSFLEFPFDTRQLSGLRVKPAPRVNTQELSAADRFPEPHTGAEFDPLAIPREIPGPFEPEAPQPARGGPNRHVWRAGLFALGMIALGAVGYQGYLAWAPRGGAAASQASDAPALGLQVGRQGADLRVSWNRNSPAIIQATDGLLSIHDGDAQHQELHLDPDQLRHGSVTYTPANADVSFRLEITAPGNSKTSETVLALTAARPALPASSQPPARGPSPQSDAAAATSPAPSKDEPLRVTMLDPPARSPLGDAPAAPQPSSPGSPSLLYLPPRPVRQVQPVLPYTVRKLIAAQIDVSVKVWISNKGTVVKAEPVLTGQLVSSSLVTAAQRAALRWRFAPAVRGTETVPSEMILKFQYRPVTR
jgi:hypothetical protein